MGATNMNCELTSLRKKERMSLHAKKRCSQRGISAESIRLVRAFGEQEFDGHGGMRYLMTSDAMAKLVRVVGRTQRLDALAGMYVVVSADDETIVTASFRH
ncbi:DUF4258 domain-containing protein [Paraburkholderia atlantica]|uniref:DUF4258 domain-containing protein n=1 Tax=Paraburkholderia atlantica TaxID=2654982 RepID=UPI000366912C|nr:DUF4258 domain-containing protein [Paraburkholderia atlantica]